MPLYLFIDYFTFVRVVMIASLRYRLPIEGLLIILAAEPLDALINYIRRRTPHDALSADNAPLSWNCTVVDFTDRR